MTTVATSASVGSDLRDLIDSFTLSLRASNKAPRTIEVYGDSLRQLTEYLQSVGAPTDISKIGREQVSHGSKVTETAIVVADQGFPLKGWPRMDWGEEWVARWNAPDVDGLVDMYSPNVRYDDVSFGRNYQGHDGIRKAFSETVTALPDFEWTYNGGFKGDRHFVIEWSLSGTASGEKRVTTGASLGILDGDGRILEQRDYWNPMPFFGGGVG